MFAKTRTDFNTKAFCVGIEFVKMCKGKHFLFLYNTGIQIFSRIRIFGWNIIGNNKKKKKIRKENIIGLVHAL